MNNSIYAFEFGMGFKKYLQLLTYCCLGHKYLSCIVRMPGYYTSLFYEMLSCYIFY